MVTRQEKHSTRGRAHLLFEMMQGEEIENRWRSEEVKDALDLCLAARAGSATVRSTSTWRRSSPSFFPSLPRPVAPADRLRLRVIYWVARTAAMAHGLVNFFTQTAPFSAMAKWMAGGAHQRTIPRSAHETFSPWFCKNGRKESSPGTKNRVILCCV
jgi:hypothetical protein